MDEQRAVTQPAPDSGADPLLYRLVVAILGATIIITILSVAILSFLQTTNPPESLIAIGSMAVGGLVGLLAPTPAQR